ncbi:unnamed protein product [Ranitomeya imitator]|uniref:Uncharacterized protein n=1 Tax=Ranitomeya imitator TaxID=111125 RepID=A0ABN9KR99_9NEOB|nr:unnamed protein product [Ranitomeya imitator]
MYNFHSHENTEKSLNEKYLLSLMSLGGGNNDFPTERKTRGPSTRRNQLTKLHQSNIQDIYRQVLSTLESLKGFWDTLDEIDTKTWVLEPERPTRGATMRRIAIGNNVSITIDLNPRHPTMLPECYFLGADHVVQPLKEKLNSNVHLWDPENGLLQNLKDILETDFPSKSEFAKSDFTMDCGICYAYRLDSAIPDQVCNDPHCAQPFHQACLYEWLNGLPSSRQSFNIIYGECPYCTKHGNQGKHRVTKRGPALSYPMFTLVTGIVGRWRAISDFYGLQLKYKTYDFNSTFGAAGKLVMVPTEEERLFDS